MNPQYRSVALRAFHRCEYCRAPEAVFNFPFEVEHIIPLSQGGDDSLENLALSCRGCNLFKGVHCQGIDPLSGECSRLFNPRSDTWDEHFCFDSNTMEIAGLSPIGRATIVQMQMNRAVQLTARFQWIPLGLFP